METIQIQNKKKRNKGPIIFFAIVGLLILIVLLLNITPTKKHGKYNPLNSSDDFPKLDVEGKYIGGCTLKARLEKVKAVSLMMRVLIFTQRL